MIFMEARFRHWKRLLRLFISQFWLFFTELWDINSQLRVIKSELQDINSQYWLFFTVLWDINLNLQVIKSEIWFIVTIANTSHCIKNKKGKCDLFFFHNYDFFFLIAWYKLAILTFFSHNSDLFSQNCEFISHNYDFLIATLCLAIKNLYNAIMRKKVRIVKQKVAITFFIQWRK